jgi:hypothetical protein
MSELNTALLGQACSIFMELAYPEGLATVPVKKRAYYSMDPTRPLSDYLPPSPQAGGIVQELSSRKDGPRGYEFRLGCCHFQHLKLRVQLMEQRGNSVWVFTVDTHDAFSPPAGDPRAAEWLAMKETNRQLKDQIEDELDQAGFETFKSLLRGDLKSSVAR